MIKMLTIERMKTALDAALRTRYSALFSEEQKMPFHLPSSRQTKTRYIRLNTSRCKACWECVQVCPQHVFGKVDFWFHRHACIDQADDCRGCLRCLKVCSHQAILSTEKACDNTSR